MTKYNNRIFLASVASLGLLSSLSCSSTKEVFKGKIQERETSSVEDVIKMSSANRYFPSKTQSPLTLYEGPAFNVALGGQYISYAEVTEKQDFFNFFNKPVKVFTKDTSVVPKILIGASINQQFNAQLNAGFSLLYDLNFKTPCNYSGVLGKFTVAGVVSGFTLTGDFGAHYSFDRELTSVMAGAGLRTLFNNYNVQVGVFGLKPLVDIKEQKSSIKGSDAVVRDEESLKIPTVVDYAAGIYFNLSILL